MKKLQYKNDWEAHRYSTDDGEVIDLDEVNIDGMTYAVKSKIDYVPYNDMGHSYTAASKQFYITLRTPLALVDIPLSQIMKNHAIFVVR